MTRAASASEMNVVREAFLRVSDVSPRASRRASRQYSPHDGRHRQGSARIHRPDIGERPAETADFGPARRRSPGQTILTHAFDSPVVKIRLDISREGVIRLEQVFTYSHHVPK